MPETAKPSRTVGIIFACYNNEEIAPVCLQSCLQQDYENIKVIVADDGSRDKTCEALRQAAAEDTRFTLLELPHGERGVARAAATKTAIEQDADFIYIIDSDMILEPGLVKSCVQYFDNNPSVGGLVIPEKPFSTHRNFMSRVKVFERKIMNNAGEDLGKNSIEAARFWRLSEYQSSGGIHAGQIAFEETQPTIRYLENGGILKRATFTGVRHDEKRVTLPNLLAKKRYYFSVMDKTIESESGGWRKAISRSYFFRPVLYRPANVANYARSPLMAFGMFLMYFVLSGYAALDILKGLKKR